MSEPTTPASPTPVTPGLLDGAPIWIDISVRDLERSQEFYRQVLGWEFTTSNPESFGGYTQALVNGQMVAGMAPPMPGMEEPPHFWTTYLAVSDSATTQEAITAAGGSVMMPPMQLEELGTMGIFTDPTGAVFGTWQPGVHTGFEISRVPGSLTWSEAMVGDYDQGKAFYTEVFGWTYNDMSADGMKYAIFTVPGDGSGMSGGIGQVEAGENPYWSVVFAVDDVDAAVQRVLQAGGGLMAEPFDFEFGRVAVVTGPDGEPFAVNHDPNLHAQG